MLVGVPKESFPGERRVALAPTVVPTLTKAGFKVMIEAGAGTSGFRRAVSAGAILAAGYFFGCGPGAERRWDWRRLPPSAGVDVLTGLSLRRIMRLNEKAGSQDTVYVPWAFP